ncbi:hypothetical protein KG112_01730 [Nocardioides sp. zg-ZUI104]|uniref:hypothetical protein n=1 Tax=Nocardioides faecalis TaxID=2803858 RepID=UPI001BCA829E|nr:hypothetical protein [Nocardioides faecalis]MBS4751526.1 hypothetical protein [Nocardioides faecalis]
MTLRRSGSARAGTVALALVCATALAACSTEPAPAETERIVLSPLPEGEDHVHAPGQEHGGTPVGDGTRAEAGGYRLADVTLPAAGAPGEMSFRVLDDRGEPLTSYTPEQTKELHLYVVRADLASFRHLHPTRDDDGTWRARVDLDTPGEWRVVAELTPEGAAQAVVLGSTLRVPGEWTPVPAPRGPQARVGDDGVVKVRVDGTGEVSGNGRLRLLVTDTDDRPLTLGSYLGASAHLTGFGIGPDGGFVHVHPFGSPEVTDEGTALTFHTTFTTPGDLRLFVQVRVAGLLHQVAVTATVA